MTKPTKAQAKERIQRVLDKIPPLEDLSTDEPEFQIWRRDTRSAIENTFTDNPNHVQEFERIRYYPSSVLVGGDPFRRAQRERESYLRGLNSASALLTSMLNEIEEYWVDDVQSQMEVGQLGLDEPIASNRVFVVHGRDEAAKQTVARFLGQLGLEPVILQEQPDEGRTVIDKFEEYAQVGFAVVLCTPDDVGALAGEADNLKPRPRQNVVLEWGFFLGKIGRNRVCALLKDDIEIPSDYAGVIYIPMDEAEGWKLRLSREMQVAGLPVDLNRLA